MPTLNTFYLTFRAGLHVGQHGIGQERALTHIPADTLFAALVAARAQLQADAGEWVEQFKKQPSFRLSSAFPYAGGVRFYPRPIKWPENIAPKTWRKIRFVSEGVLRRLVSGSLPDSWLPEPADEKSAGGLTLQGGALWLSREEIERLPEPMRTKNKNGKRESLPPQAIRRQNVWFEMTVPRVTVDRLTNASEIFHTARIVFAPECGLWFGVQEQDTAPRSNLNTLNALGDLGLGAERSAGYGAFVARAGEPISWPDPQADGLMLLLSRYHPGQGETALWQEGAAYHLIRVAGRVQTLGQANQRRRSVWLVAEGSIIGGSAQGELVDVKPTVGSFPHSVYRCGLALGVGMEGGL